MKKFILISLFIFVIIFFNNSKMYAQACGGSTFTIEIYVLNGTKEVDINYEVFPIYENYLSIIPDYQARSRVIEEKYALQIMNIAEKRDSILGSATAGKVENGIIKFNTMELGSTLYLLKLSTKNKNFYKIGSYFSGCNGLLKILWREEEYKNPLTCGY